jgi:hypothetical protein
MFCLFFFMYVPKGDPPRRAVARTSVRHSILGNPALATRLQPAKSPRAAVGDWARQPPSRVTPPAVYTCHPPGRPERRANGKRPRSLGAARARQRRRVAVRWRSRTSVRPRPATRGRRKATRPSRQRPASDARNKNQNSKKKNKTFYDLGPRGAYPIVRIPRPPAEKKGARATARHDASWASRGLPWPCPGWLYACSFVLPSYPSQSPAATSARSILARELNCP